MDPTFQTLYAGLFNQSVSDLVFSIPLHAVFLRQQSYRADDGLCLRKT